MANFPDIINYFSPYWKLSIFSITASNEVIQHLSQDDYTVVGELGVRLSGGQRQRLGIARTLIH